MFEKATYSNRRQMLREKVGNGLILLLTNGESPMNYRDNTYRYRQDSTFLYFFGLDTPGLEGVLDAESGEEILFGDEITLDDIIWSGPQASLKDRAGSVGVQSVRPRSELGPYLREAMTKGRRIHFLPPYRDEQRKRIEELLGVKGEWAEIHLSTKLIAAVVDLRSVKEPQEIEEIEKALATTRKMHLAAMAMAKPGVWEREIAGRVEGEALCGGGTISFPVILSVHGETLHNHTHRNRLEAGNLLINDSGAETEAHYSGDITRTIPVGGSFTKMQREIYDLVLTTQKRAIGAIRPGIPFREVHLLAAKTIAEGLSAIGLMKGDPAEAVEQGAHALFFPHGLGHMMGLDVHDMENLGESYVGYGPKWQRSRQFGLAALRMARELEKGFVVTVEPGLYFIPALIDQWKREKRLEAFIDYKVVEKYKAFGGIRIEDDVLVTEGGCRILGEPIPKEPKELEEIVGRGL